MSIDTLLYAGLEAAANRYLRLDPAAKSLLVPLHGRVLAFEIIGLGRTVYLIPGPHGVQLFPRYEGEADCLMRGTPLALARMADPQQSADHLFSGQVEISGDTALAHELGKVIAAMDVDWEEQLSRITGDLIAHHSGNALRGLAGWARESRDSLRLDLGEYLQEELRLLPVRAEVEQYLGDVDLLRDDVERLEARLQRLQAVWRSEG